MSDLYLEDFDPFTPQSLPCDWQLPDWDYSKSSLAVCAMGETNGVILWCCGGDIYIY